MRYPTPNEWPKLVEEFRAGELERKEFAAKHDMSLGTFRSRLYKNQSWSTPRPTRGQFLPVAVVASPAAKARATPGSLEATLPSGVTAFLRAPTLGTWPSSSRHSGSQVFSLQKSVRILLAAQPVDMRNSIDGLVAMVRTGRGENVYTGHLFAFVCGRRDRVKILSWDNGGFVVVYKRLKQGRFRLAAFHEEALGAQLDSTQLSMLLDGIDLSRVRRPKKCSLDAQEGVRQASENVISTDRPSCSGVPRHRDHSFRHGELPFQV